jgi:hypothetical protein
MNATEKRIAFHEASHAVVARLRGVEIVAFDLHLAGRDSHGNVRTRTAAWVVERNGGDAAAMLAALETDVVVALAGMISEVVRRPEMKLRDGPERANDSANIRDRLRRCVHLRLDTSVDQPRAPTPEERAEFDRLYEQLWCETAELVQAHWPAIEHLAGVLLQRRRGLDQAEIDALLEASREPAHEPTHQMRSPDDV